ncbi:putative gustatory receptor 28b [Vespa velutina]|uniref:putative gustatory receptor 28b n=1 Tax=Vespa velutina TaxID=202808 RepID=UPI001FB236A6|nr:putative gustatory receptor 28b [Vespa velutina]
MRNLIERIIKKMEIRSIFKIYKAPSKSIDDVLRPIYILSNIFGLRVFVFPRGQSRPILSFLYSMSLCCLYSAGRFHYVGWINKTNMYKLDGTIFYVVIIINQIVIFVILMMRLYQNEAMKLCTKRINEVDKTLQALNSSALFNCIYKTTIKEIVFTIIYLFLSLLIIIFGMVIIDQFNYKSDVIVYFLLHIYSFMVEFLLVFEFLTFVRCIKSEFQRANELLGDVSVLPVSSIASELVEHKENDGSFSLERTLPVNSRKLFIVAPSLRQTQSQLQIASHKINRSRILLRTIRQIHLELYKVSKNLSNMYGIQISLEIGICVFLSTYMLYYFYVESKKETYNIQKVIFPFMIMVWCCFQYGMKIFIVNYICNKTTKEAEHTNEIIHTFYGNSTDIEIQKEVEIFSLQMMQCRNVYSAFGLYNLNCKHICSVSTTIYDNWICIGIITTYLVIMIQVTDEIKEGS